MRPLVAVRRAAAFDPRVFERGALFWPLARAVKALGQHDDFPSVEALARVFDESPPVRFVAAAPRRRRREPVDARALYDARITLEGVVPARARCWHDLMNALVWGTFPRAKRALHARQHRAITAQIAPDARALPPVRTRELDALALLDEGGVAVLARNPDAVRAQLSSNGDGVLGAYVASGAAAAVVFGHAIYESLALGVAPAVVAVVVLDGNASQADLVRSADQTLARVIQDDTKLRTPTELRRVQLSEAMPASRPDHR